MNKDNALRASRDQDYYVLKYGQRKIVGSLASWGNPTMVESSVLAGAMDTGMERRHVTTLMQYLMYNDV